MTYTLEVAGVGARSYAFVLDWHIRLLAALLWIYLVAFLFYDLSVFSTLFEEDRQNTTAAWIIFMPAAIVYFLYHPILETAMHGSTPGKRMAGVRLITLEGHTPGIGSILIRNIFRLIDSLPGVYTVGLLVVIFTRNQVRIGDISAGTVLIYEKKGGRQSLSDVARQSLDSRLSTENYDLLLELLDRWAQLEKHQRIHLAQQFLNKIGDELHSDDPNALKTRLQELVDN
ncbi:MAG: RDD family protein [Gammaproteobacteria bacterium]|nr:RDD family protein [Gammaproteobacteria bacterium]